jgi:membrane associated rhomboid family serine protease
MTTTPVGMRCPECSKERTKVTRLRQMSAVPSVTYALIAVNVVAFLAEGRFSFAGGGSTTTIFDKGALLGSALVQREGGVHQEGVAYEQWWRIITGGFLHENLIHILFNMYVLYVLGQMLEPALGRLKFGLVYGVSLLTGSLGALLVSPHSFTVGASGAVFGLMGAAAVELRARQIPVFQTGVGGLILINLIISFSIPGISWGGHVGGLIGGALAAATLQLGARYRAQALALAGCVVIAIAAASGAVAAANSSKLEAGEGGAPVGALTPGP